MLREGAAKPRDRRALTRQLPSSCYDRWMVVRVVVSAVVVIVTMGVSGAADAGTARFAASRSSSPPSSPSSSPPSSPSAASPYLTGPARVELDDHAELELPAGMILFERAEAQRLLRKAGEPVEGVVAIVQQPAAGWSILLSYNGAGHIDDADASRLDAEEMLAVYRRENRTYNERRRGVGAPEIVIDGWIEPPRYERAQHRLVWGVAAHASDGKLVNHFTRIIGRDGFLSVNLISAAATMERAQREARSIVQATRFQPGWRYEDQAPGDRSAGAGLRSLVLGESGVAVAAELGLLAQLALVWKPELIALFLGIAGLVLRWPRGRLRRWLQRKRPGARARRVARLDGSRQAPAHEAGGVLGGRARGEAQRL
jgi:uncharacterized membrane-anchored protein